MGITARPCRTEGFAPGILPSACFSTGHTPLRQPLAASRRSRSVPVLLFLGCSRPRWGVSSSPAPRGPEELGFPQKTACGGCCP